ncbi:MAG: methionine--tRNA ligase subunit beta, partial [Bacilli bacterium]
PLWLRCACYFLLREIPFGQDGVFTLEALMERLNFDLANDLGNLVHRSLAMLERFAGGVIPSPGAVTQLESDYATLIREAAVQVEDALDRFEFGPALSAIWTIVRRANRYIDETAPWALHKAGDRDRLDTVLYTVFEVIRSVGVLLQPFMPNTPLAIWSQMGLTPGPSTSWESAKQFGALPSGLRTSRGDPIFPRLDVAAELAALEELTAGGKAPTLSAAEAGQGRLAAEASADRGADASAAALAAPAANASVNAESGTTQPEQIELGDFARVDLRVALVVAAERIPKADKLLKLQLDVGGERRQVVSGIARHYAPEELPGRQVILVANLKPVMLRGVESQGMILAASDGELLTLATLADAIRPGVKVK